jgi:translation initiation factor eIF-2B subunit delta
MVVSLFYSGYGAVFGQDNKLTMRRIADSIEAIGQDNVSGATALTLHGAEALAVFARTCPAKTPQAFREALIQVGRQLVAAQPSMASMLHLANQVLSAAEGPDNLNGLRAQTSTAAQGFAQLLRQHAKAVARHATDLMPDPTTVVTLSHSSAVREALLAAHRQGKQVHIVCSESRPANEGLGLARLLAEAGLTTTLVADAALPAWIGEAQVVLVGADSVSVEGVVNKTGTYGLALAARHHHVPLYALCGSEKFWPATFPSPSIKDKPAEELWPHPPPDVKIVNRYFESTPLPFFAAIVTEDDLLTADQVRQVLTELKIHPSLQLSNHLAT